MKILTKQDMYKKFHAGEFGNRTQMWPSFKEFVDQRTYLHADCKFALRYMEKPNGPCTYNLKWNKIGHEYERWKKLGYKDQYIQVSEMIDDNLITLAGEVKRSENYYDLTYYQASVPMREGLQKYCKHAQGLTAWALLQTYMDNPSILNLQHLFELYPDAVIEFTCCSRSVGVLGWNTVFWEVRNY